MIRILILTVFGIGALLQGLFSTGVTLLAATPQEAGEQVTRLNMGFDMGIPGSRVSLPIVLSAPKGIRVGTTINEITFPDRWLAFEEVRGGVSADLAEAEVIASVRRDEENADNAIVQVTVTARQGEALLDGVVASVVFRVADAAPVDQAIRLTNVARALSTDTPPQPIEPVAGTYGGIELTAEPTPMLACLFYMH